MMNQKTAFFLALSLSLCVLVSGQPLLAASFNCAKARTYVERTICNDDELSAADDFLDDAYNEARKTTGNSRKFQGYARARLAERNRCTNKTCIRKWYERTTDQYERISRRGMR